MPNINIPAPFIPGIKEIALLSENEFSKVLESLRTVDTENSKESLKNLLKVYLDDEKADSIASSIFSFGYLLIRHAGDQRELATSITESFISFLKSDDETMDIEIFEAQSKTTEDRLSDILVLSDFLLPSYEGVRSVFEGNRVLVSSDITSEILLINDRKYKKPATGVIVNKLRLDTRLDDDGAIIVITVDKTDLLELKRQVDKALKESDEMEKSYKEFINFIKL
jgi:hypothetical protein